MNLFDSRFLHLSARTRIPQVSIKKDKSPVKWKKLGTGELQASLARSLMVLSSEINTCHTLIAEHLV